MMRLHLNALRSLLLTRRSRHRVPLDDLPPGLEEYWRQNAGRDFPGIPGDTLFFTRAAEGLLDYFDCARLDSMPCALPSRAAESVWRAWARYSPARLEAFCLRHFDRTLFHVDGSAIVAPSDAAILRTLAHARGLEGLPKTGRELPRLFTLDRRLRMPRGFGYASNGAGIYYQYLSGSGRAEGVYHFVRAATATAANHAGAHGATRSALTERQASRTAAQGTLDLALERSVPERN